MVEADATRGFERLAQGTSRPVPSDVQVRSSPVATSCAGALVQVERGEHGRVLQTEGWEELPKALTEGAISVLGGIREVVPFVQRVRRPWTSPRRSSSMGAFRSTR